ncbi:tripartite motif-containing protein 16-like [Myxocyprinus asiaticus]|uniref:tripartite motif-containing protein 16-like n=1 Tax=Myxocyprinus asiaticus TaxID=70543 RepID=UPI0022239839|nr:tripartite motif-containing protein 16-like [Myxocyprinus asiaticus]XP_051535207.1 tripartite motif-containing protein 16-like [Myxocyprinus asiaticus]
MAESSGSEYQEQFSCPVCLDPLKEPVTIPCGHSYCMSCITDCWDQKDQMPPYHCPQCRETFTQRPVLKKNTVLAEMMEKLQKTSIHTASCSQEVSCVECDFCTTEKNRAVKSCLQCLASFCEAHLQPHYQSPAFMKHKLVKVSTHIQENICLNHGKLLDVYCQDDSQCICYLCMINNHKGHSVVSVECEWTNKRKVLKKTKVTCQMMIQERERGQQELSGAVKTFKSSAQEAVEECKEVLNGVMCTLEKKCSEMNDLIRAQEKQLDQELTELRQRDEEIQKLLITDNQVHFLKSFQSLCVLPTFQDLPSITQQTSLKDILFSVLRGVLEDVLQKETFKTLQDVSNVHVAEPPKTSNEFLRYFCQLHLDPNTAHENLILSEGNRKVSGTDKVQRYPDHPDRFEWFRYILCRESLNGRCYWEVECSGRNWAVAVCYKGISRKALTDNGRLGFNKKSWRFGYFQENFGFIHDKVRVPIPAASRIGVYLDHKAGTLSFYSFDGKMTLLHRVQTTFTEPLYPAFQILEDSSVRIIQKRGVQNECY